MPKYTVYRNANGFATAIEKDEVVLLHLVEGSKRNEKEIDAFVETINEQEKAIELLRRIMKGSARSLCSDAMAWIDAQALIDKYQDEQPDNL